MFWKKNKVKITKEIRLRNSLANNRRVIPYLTFIWFGLMFFYILYSDLWLLVFACMVFSFIAMHTLAYKIDSTRLELLNLNDKISIYNNRGHD